MDPPRDSPSNCPARHMLDVLESDTRLGRGNGRTLNPKPHKKELFRERTGRSRNPKPHTRTSLKVFKIIGGLVRGRGVGDHTSLNRPYALIMGIKAPLAPLPLPP